MGAQADSGTPRQAAADLCCCELLLIHAQLPHSPAQDGSYAARGGLEFASTLNSCLSQPAVDQLKEAVAEAQAAARAILQQQAAAQEAAGGAGGALAAMAGASAALRRVWSKRTD